MDDEIWRPIKKYEGIYEISSYWRVRSLDRYDRRGTFHKGRFLKTRKKSLAVGHEGIYVRLSKNGQCRDMDIQYIMVRTFEDSDDFQVILSRKPQ